MILQIGDCRFMHATAGDLRACVEMRVDLRASSADTMFFVCFVGREKRLRSDASQHLFVFFGERSG